MLTNCLVACTHLSSTVSQLFEPQPQKNRHFLLPPPTFLFPLETSPRLSRNMLHGWKDNSMLAKPHRITRKLLKIDRYLLRGGSIDLSFHPCNILRKSKNRYFYHILVPLGTPLGQSRKMLYGRKENSMLTNCLAACGHLSITVCEIERDICKKNPPFIIAPPCIRRPR